MALNCNFNGGINSCVNIATVRGSGQYVGGIVGIDGLGIIQKCINAGFTQDNRYVGGIVGDNNALESQQIQHCVATGVVKSSFTGSSDVVPIIGRFFGTINSIVANCYYDIADSTINSNFAIFWLI